MNPIGRNRLTRAQFLYLAAVRQDPAELKRIEEKMKSKPWQLTAWLRRPIFRAALADAKRESRRRRKLAFEMNAREATQVLSKILAGEGGTHLQRQAAFDTLALDEQQQHRPGRKRKPGPSTPPALIHPDVPPEEALRHIEVLEGKDGPEESAAK